MSTPHRLYPGAFLWAHVWSLGPQRLGADLVSWTLLFLFPVLGPLSPVSQIVLLFGCFSLIWSDGA